MNDKDRALLRYVVEGDIRKAQQQAKIILEGITTAKDEQFKTRCLSQLSAKAPELIELPYNMQGLLVAEDVTNFPENRYLLRDSEKAVIERLLKTRKASLRLKELGIHYTCSLLLQGEPGTGKTEFAKYVAFKLGLPYAYLNFSYLIDSYMGKTAQNLNRIFDYCKGKKCVLMFDEIDCIGIERGHDTGADGELGRTTIALMQSLDGLVDGQIVIGATNRRDRLDKALLRRFQRQVEFKPFDKEERQAMIEVYMNSVDSSFLTDEIIHYADESHTQAEIIKFLIEQIVKK